MANPRLGSILGAAAVIVALPRHVVAALHAAGLTVPRGEAWDVVVIASAVALAILEALTIGYAMRARLVRHVWLMLAVVSVTFAPSLVADSAGLSLVQLTGAASVAHYVWSAALVAANLLIVQVANAADAALASEHDRLTAAHAEAAAAERRASDARQALTDGIDMLRQELDTLRQDVGSRSAAMAAQSVTVNVASATPPSRTASDLRGVQVADGAASREARETAVAHALGAGRRTLPALAEATGIPISQIRRTAAWQTRQEVVA